MKVIKTTVPRKKNSTIPHRSYMKISCLEMERVRLTTEKNKALARITAITTRLNQIDTEKERLLENLKENSASVLSLSEESNQKSSDFGLKLKY